MSKFAVILAAAGKSDRFKDKNYKKPFAPLAGRAVWLHSAEKFLNREDVKQLLIVIAAEDREYFQFKFAANVAILGIDVVDGGQQRADSIQQALARVRRKSTSSPCMMPPGLAWPTNGSATSLPRPKRAAPRSWRRRWSAR